jgi:small subunit ribosomal protein S5
MILINLYNDTIPHEAEAKVGGAHILIKPAAPGTGLKAGGVVRVVLEVAGVRNVLSKSLGSSNKINAAYATLTALKLIEPQEKWVTRQVYTKSEPSSKIEETTEKTEQAPKDEVKPVKKVTATKPKAKTTKTTDKKVKK